MSCSYSDIAMAVYDEKTMDHPFKPLIWKRFCDVIVIWIHSNKDANCYLNYLNTIDASGKIICTMETENGLEFLDFTLKLKDCYKITVDVYSKPTTPFFYN